MTDREGTGLTINVSLSKHTNNLTLVPSIVSNPYSNEFGEYTYYCHEDSKGQKVEYRKSKLKPLNNQESKEEDDSYDGDTVTTPISTSQMKSEFRDRHLEDSRERIYHKILMKCMSSYVTSFRQTEDNDAAKHTTTHCFRRSLSLYGAVK